MAGKKDIVEQALKLIAGGGDDAAKRIASIRRSEPFPADYIEPGSVRYRYEHPDTSSFMEIITRPKGARSASVIGLEVPEEYRGTGIGKALQERVLQDYPSLMGQVSSKAAAVNAYKAGRRPLSNPNATLEDVFKMIDEDSSVNLATPKNTGGRIAKGPGGWVDDVVKMAGKVISGEGEDAAKAAGIIPGTFPGKKLPNVDALARNVDKFVYHSGVAEDIPSMKYGIDPQIGPWVTEVLEGSAEDDLVNEVMENAVPVSWWSKRPDWAVMKVARKLGKNPRDVTPEELAQHGHVALIPKKDPEAESMYWIGEQGLSSGPYSEVEDITGRKLKAYEADLYSGNYGPEGVERNEYITPRTVEPYLHLTGDELLDFLRKTGTYNKAHGGRARGGNNSISGALNVARGLNGVK